MKRSLLVASCVLLVSGLLSSCQKEDKNIVQLADELTAELQQIVDPASANAHAKRVAVLNKRFQDASVRVLALNDTSLARGANDDDDHQGEDYAVALKNLAREMGRVRASFPGGDDGGNSVNRERLLIAIGAVAGKTGAACKEYGEEYMHDETGAHETPGNFPEYYGCDALREALSYTANLADSSSFKFDGDEDVPAVPAVGEAREESSSSASEESDESAPASDDAAPEPADDEDTGSADEDSDSSLGDDLDEL